ncbi:MAG: hypothetical protein ABSG71_11665, partial [Thermodesulfobacteriota bacterium]
PLELMRIKSSNTSDGKDARMKVKRSLTYFKVPRACPWVSTNLYIVMFGVFIGILTMRFAATLFTLMILKEPILKPAAYIVVFNIGAELLLDEFAGIEFAGTTKFMISAGTLILAVVYAHIKPLHLLQPVFNQVGQGMGKVNELLDWILKPVGLLFKIIFQGIGFVLRTIINSFRGRSING